MSSQDILRALRSGKISVDDARRALAEVAVGVTGTTHPAPAAPHDAIAIVGMSGRYPGADDLDRYWENLAQARNAIQEVPATRWDVNRNYDPRPGQAGKVYCKWIGLLEDIDQFDPLFFMISPAEAEQMDPQHRVFLQEAYRAFEDAGYGRPALSNRNCGVYLGIMGSEYERMLQQSHTGATSATGNSFAIAAARISYFLNLKGPAIAIDTACSSSLVATHLACQALRNHEVDMALAGGVSLYLTEDTYLSMCAAGMLSPDGQCKAFDNDANGFVPGEGAGALVLKRLADAQADGDTIHGVILGSGINQDGKTNGITAPSVNSQIELTRELYRRHRIDPASISYVEMHGTGTRLGDPIELEALATVFGEGRARPQACAIGSVKSNIGHTLVAAGVASVHKVLLCLRHRQLVPTLNFRTPNEHFDFEASPFRVNTALTAWDSPPGRPRRAAVSSFGYSGTNAHLVIEEYRPPVAPQSEAPVLVVLSARSREQLRRYAARMKDWVDAHPDVSPSDLAYTLQVGRDPMEHRLAFVAAARAELGDRLQAFLAETPAAGLWSAQARKHGEELALFETDDDARALLQGWVRQRKLDKLAELWVKGLSIDWNQLYPDARPRRISLPTYPFARERCWFTESVSGHGHSSVPASPVSGNTALMFARPVWERKPLPPAAVEGPILGKGDLCIYLCHEDLDRRVDGGLMQGPVSTDAAACWLTYTGTGSDVAATEFQAISVRLFNRIREHLDQHPHEAFRLLFVSDNSDKALVYQNGLLALLKSVQQERPEIRLKAIHLPADLWASSAAFVTILGRELEADATVDVRVRYRSSNGDRDVEEFEPLIPDPVPAPLPSADHDLVWITGGTGGLAQVVASYLMQRGVRNVLLTGRTAANPEMNKRLTALLKTDAASGAMLEYHRADVTVDGDVERIVQMIRERNLNLKGIIHAAGVIRDAPIETKTAVQFEAVLAPKVQGLDNLDRHTRDEKLDYFVLFSSLAGIAGNAGQCDYACANGFMDGFARYRNALVEGGKRHGSTVSINWPYWAEGGMSLDRRLQETMRETTGMVSLSSANGMSALATALRNRWTQVMVAEVEYRSLQSTWVRTFSMHGNGRGPKAVPVASSSVGDALLAILSQVTRIPVDRITPDHSLAELGLDSIVSMQVFNEITRQFGVRIFVAEMQALKTVGEFVGYLQREIAAHAPAPVSEPAAAPRPHGRRRTVKGSASTQLAARPTAPAVDASIQGERTRRTIFVLGTPRAGSTLLRVMLAGNPEIFSPPELYLLGYTNMSERAEQLDRRKQAFLKEGLVEALRVLTQSGIDEARARVTRFERDGTSVAAVYRHLHAHTGNRYLVDKTPAYGHRVETLKQAEQDVVEPVYLYLHRHPLAVMGSLVKNRFHRMLQIDGDPWEIAENIWTTWNENITGFLRSIPVRRQIHIPYEDMVAHPESWMRFICERLGIEYDPGMIHPHRDPERKMTGGLHAESLMIGDPNFLSHRAIDPALAQAWTAHRDRWPALRQSTRDLAARLGYTVEGDGLVPQSGGLQAGAALLPAEAGFLGRNDHDPVWHIIAEFALQSRVPDIDRDAIQRNLAGLFERFPALRMALQRKDRGWVPVPAAGTGCDLVWLDGRTWPTATLEAETAGLRSRLQEQLDIRTGAVLAVGVIRLDAGRYRFVLVLHHLAGDGFSMHRIINSLLEPAGCASAQLSRDDYLELVRLYGVPSCIERLAAEWKAADGVEPTILSGKRETGSNLCGEETECRVDVRIHEIPGVGGPSADQLGWESIAAGLYLVLARGNDDSDVTIAHRFHRRDLSSHFKMADDVGYYAGDLPVTVDAGSCQDMQLVRERLSRIRSELVLGGAEYEILENLRKVRPVSDVTRVRLNYQPFPLFFGSDTLVVSDIDIRLYEPDHHVRTYDVDCIVRQDHERLMFVIRYNPNHYPEARIRSFVGDWIRELGRNRIDEPLSRLS